MPLRARPLRHVSAVLAASSSGVMPSRAAAASSIQGRKSLGRSSGNVSRRLPMSPLGSMTRQGMPRSSASSSRSMPRPVLPLPVMPTMTPWVVRSAGSSVSGPSVSSLCPMKSSSGSMPVMGSLLRRGRPSMFRRAPQPTPSRGRGRPGKAAMPGRVATCRLRRCPGRLVDALVARCRPQPTFVRLRALLWPGVGLTDDRSAHSQRGRAAGAGSAPPTGGSAFVQRRMSLLPTLGTVQVRPSVPIVVSSDRWLHRQHETGAGVDGGDRWLNSQRLTGDSVE